MGKIFRKHNVIEYKNPDDSLNSDVVWKVIGYAGLYKGLAEHVNEIPAEELTISIFRNRYPRELFKEWKKEGIEISHPYDGVYYVEGVVPAPADYSGKRIGGRRISEPKNADARGEGEGNPKISAIRSIMEKFHLTEQEAMNALDIPPHKQAEYAERLLYYSKSKQV